MADSSHGERTGRNNTFNLVMGQGGMALTLMKDQNSYYGVKIGQEVLLL